MTIFYLTCFLDDILILQVQKMIDFASKNNTYLNAKVINARGQDVLVTARMHPTDIQIYIIGTKLTEKTRKRIKELDIDTSFVHVQHQNFVQLIEQPFVSMIPLIDKTVQSYYCVPFRTQGLPLYSWLGKLSKTDILDCMAQLTQVLEELFRRKNIIFGDLNPDCIFLEQMQQKGRNFKVKIVPPRCRVIRKMEIPQSTLTYKAPQILKQGEGEKSDIWTLGLILFELSEKRKLEQLELENAQELSSKVKGHDFSYLLGNMLKINANKRFHLSDLNNLLESMLHNEVHGAEYLISMIKTARISNKSNQKIKDAVQCQEKRVVLDGFLLSLVYNPQLKTLRFRLLYKRTLQQFLVAEYKYGQLPRLMKMKWASLDDLMKGLSKKKKKQIKFMTDGHLSIVFKDNQE